jgi:hypothetical protein
MTVMARGYEPEAEAFVRTIVELFVASQEFLKDGTGETARRWLREGMGKGIAKRVDRALTGNVSYGMLSRAAHGDPRALLALAAEGGGSLEWGPRTTPAAAGTLRYLAVSARDFTVLLEQEFGARQPELHHLDEWLASAIPSFSPSAAPQAA